jgi:hypothetical protein
MKQNIDEMKKAWEAALDSDVIRAAARDWDGYSSEAQAVIETEVRKRGLSKEVFLAQRERPRVKITTDVTENIRRLSESSTFFFKFIFPVVWSSLFGAGTIGLFLENQPEKVGFLVAFILSSMFIWFVGYDLKKVSVEGECIVISNYFRTCRIPLSEIYSVCENRIINPKLIWITFKSETAFGKRIKFTPVDSFGDWFSYFGRKHSVVKYIENLIERTDASGGGHLNE